MASAREEETPASPGDEESTENQAEGAGSTDAQNHSAGQEEDAGDEGTASKKSMALAIEDVSSLPGETVNDQDGRKLGQVKEIYAVGDSGTPMWVTVESSTGIGRSRELFVPLARLKLQNDELRVPYSFDHIHQAPDVEPEDELSEEDDRALRAYYAIGLGDQELVQAAQSYASQVPDEEGAARKIEAGEVDGPAREIDDTPPGERVAAAYEKQKEEEGEEHRKGKDTTADEIFQKDGEEKGSKDAGEDESSKDAGKEESSKDAGEEKGAKDAGEKEGSKDDDGKDSRAEAKQDDKKENDEG